MTFQEMPIAEPPLAPPVKRALFLKTWFGWVDVINSTVGLVAAFWFLYLVFQSHGFFVSLVAFLFLTGCYKFGTALVFVVASSYLHFHFNAVGVWLPVVAYVTASFSLVVTLFVMHALKSDAV